MPNFSRRAWLGRLAALAGMAGLSLRRAGATAPKATKQAARYQDRPNNGRMCGMCRYFIAPGGTAGSGMMGGTMGPGMMQAGSCQLVQGGISPMGYCDFYAPLSG